MTEKKSYQIRSIYHRNTDTTGFVVCYANGEPFVQFDTVDEAIAAVKRYEAADKRRFDPFK